MRKLVALTIGFTLMAGCARIPLKVDAIHEAAGIGKISKVKALLKEHPEMVNAEYNDGRLLCTMRQLKATRRL